MGKRRWSVTVGAFASLRQLALSHKLDSVHSLLGYSTWFEASLKSRAILVISCYITNHSNIQRLKIKIVILLSLIVSVGRGFGNVSDGQRCLWSHAIAIRQWQEQLGAGCASSFQEPQGLPLHAGLWPSSQYGGLRAVALLISKNFQREFSK